MSKKVHELAKELDKTSKEIIASLAEKGMEVKSHMSVLSDEQESMVKKAFSPKPAVPAEGKEPAEKPRKKKIIAVYNAHNSQTGIKDPRGERRQNSAARTQGRLAPGQENPLQQLRPDQQHPRRSRHLHRQ